MNYLKSLACCFVYICTLFLAWHFSTIHNISRGDLRSAHIPLLIGLGLAVTGFFLSKTRNGMTVLLGQGALFGAIIGIIPCVMLYAGQLLGSMADGFFLSLIAWIFFTILIAACCGALVSAAKEAIVSLLHLDFYTTFVGILIFFSAITSVAILFTCAKDASGLLAFCCAIGLLGGAAGYVTPIPNATDTVTEADGTQHFVISTLSSGRVVTTDGVTMRATADGHYEPLN